MPAPSRPQPAPQPEPLVVIVTGSQLAAELCDRPLAYKLRERLVRALDDDAVGDAPRRVVVVSDIWYLNQEHLRALPTISVGGPAVSAASAFFADRLPSVLAVDGVMLIQMDCQHAHTPLASIWGIDAAATASAVDHFLERFLDEFLSHLAVA